VHPNRIVICSAERRGTSRFVVVETILADQRVVRTLEVDETTFAGLEIALHTHPFRRKRPEDDVVLFKSLDTPLATDQKYIGLQIVNQGSRHQLQIEASDADFQQMRGIFKDWEERFEKLRTASSSRHEWCE
jgi:hypothetical protein